MDAEGIEVVLLGYSATESESIRRVLSPLTRRYGLAYRDIHDVARLSQAIGERRSSFVVANDWRGGIDVNRVIESCQQQTSEPPIIFVTGKVREEIASHVIDCGADDYVFWDRLFQLRWIIQSHLKNRRSRVPVQSSQSVARATQVGAHLSSLLDVSTDAIIAADHRLDIVFFNKGAERIFGHTADEIIGRSVAALLPSFAVDAAQSKREPFGDCAAHEVGQRREVSAFRKDGSSFPAEVSLAVLDENGGAVSLAILRDISEKKRVTAQIEYLATHDSLTGIPNRRLFFERLSNAIEGAERDEKLMALMFIDLDGFKQVNDIFGHATGDDLLRVVAERIRGQLRASDTVARLGGDEFAVILEHLDHVDPISEVAAALLLALSAPIVTAQARIAISASIGIVICPLEAKSCKAMMVDADRAMYAAKAAGKGRFLFYSADMSGALDLDDGERALAGGAHDPRSSPQSLAEQCA